MNRVAAVNCLACTSVVLMPEFLHHRPPPGPPWAPLGPPGPPWAPLGPPGALGSLGPPWTTSVFFVADAAEAV
jgi:hypothetical protein